VKSAEEIVRAFIRQINRHDVERLTSMMTARHALIDSLGNRLAGRDTLRAAWTAYLQMVPDYKITPKATFVKRNTVIVVGVASGSYVPSSTNRSVGSWRTPAAWRAVIKRGHVAEWQVYADNEPIRNLMRQAAGNA
jgi:ketosteroid isomerase-like protein